MRISGRPLLLPLAWHALAILIFIFLPILKWKVPWGELPRGEQLSLAVLVAGYAITGLAVFVFARTEGPRAIGHALAIALSTFGLFLFALLLTRFDAPRYLLLPIFVGVALLAPLAVAPRSAQIVGIAASAVVLLALAIVGGRSVFARPQLEAKSSASNVKSTFYGLRVLSHEGAIPLPGTRGGGLDRLGERILLGTGDGHLYVLQLAGDDLKVRELPARVPANREEFAAAFGGSSQSPRLLAGYAETSPAVQTWRFRVADVITHVDGDVVRILASHHYWKQQERCFVVRVSQLETRLSDIEDSIARSPWQTIFGSQPCLPLAGELAMRGKNPFRGEEIGGRMALLDPNTLLLTLGDHGFSGIESQVAYSQDQQASYGKTIRIDLKTHASTLNTLGHRNPQGLYAAKDGRIWEAEHAAQGGDELNLLVQGANYGWPLVTYGTDYGALIWPLSQQQGHHAGFTQPVYSWLPGIGVSNLVQIERDRFPIWQGDLLLGSLGTRSLYRVVLDGDRAVVTEPIAIGKRVRDLLELDDGRFLLWTDEAALLTIEPATGSDPAMQFATLCSGCHRIADGVSHRMGPDLYQLLDRKVASAPRYDAYTPALKQFGGTWSKSRLDAFLRDPQSTVAGTSMAFPGVADAKQRSELVEYLIATSKQGGQ